MLWWGGALFGLLLPSGTLGLARGGRTWILAAGVVALLLSAWTRPKRAGRLPLVSLCWAVLAVTEAVRWWRDPGTPWVFQWGAWWETAGWLVVMLAASLAVIRHAPDPRRWLPIALCVALTGNLLGWLLEAWWGVSRWAIPHTQSGWFPSDVAWAAWGVIAWPLLWAWRKWAVLPAALGLLLAQSSSAWLALWVGWRPGGSIQRWAGRLMPVVFALYLWRTEPELLACVMSRITTWIAVVATILHAPWGIGWDFNAYHAVAAHAPFSHSVLPHPSSDWLSLVLRHGWWTVPCFLLGSWWLWRQPGDHLMQSLRCAWWLAAWQTSVSLPLVGGLVWVLWLVDRVRRADAEEGQVDPAHGAAAQGVATAASR